MPLIQNTRRLVSKMISLNIDAYQQYQERRNYLRFAPEYWENLPDLVFQKHEPVFFLSTGRCGTKLLANIFNSFDDILCYHAPQPELLFSDRMAFEEGKEQFEAYKLAIRAARFELVADCIVRKRRYFETNYRTTFFAPHLAELFPRARFVHLVRHPGSFVRSAICGRYYEGQYSDIGRIRPVEGQAARQWPAMTQFERCAWLWNTTNDFIEAFKKTTDSHRTRTFLAEDIFDEPTAIAELLDFCSLPSLSKAKLGKWQRQVTNSNPRTQRLSPYDVWHERDKQDVRRWTPLIEQYGYTL